MKGKKLTGLKEPITMQSSPLDQPITLRAFIRFYEDRIEPRFVSIENRMDLFSRELNSRFDFLFKGYEDIKQEYQVICHQLKRADSKIEGLEEKFGKIPSKWFHPDDKIETAPQELADIKFRLEAAQAALERLRDRMYKIEKSEDPSDYPRQKLALDIRILKNMVDSLENRIEKLEAHISLSPTGRGPG